ncbi:IS21 family transposase [Kitasatospora sp. NBC_01287]|uniref:Mu transposase domain-containing protein n=1 Tax=Kitasatospora sp. NBC_01287 TaxID=2903573 RepID=UPI002257C695|nr:IS21 family transposase [Kitasatospora sp. NBC_01287]MCX4751026.1 IS21 family transposase [Kitasatospora sp. NBC_01287]
MDAHALRRQGWSISAIARHLGRDRKTIRAHLNGERVAAVRSPALDGFLPFLAYCRQRLTDDPHLWAATLFDEIIGLGYQGGYSTFTRALRKHRVRPHCEPCDRTTGRDRAIIEHPAGEEIQFDWVELPDPPDGWNCGSHAHLLVGALAHSGRWRGVLAESEQFPHLVEAIEQVMRRLGGTARRWRFDRMSTVCHPPTGKVTPGFAGVAKYYGVGVDICPPRRGNRKGVVEKANHTAAQRWWRTVPDGISIEAAQSGIDKLAVRMDGRRRMVAGLRCTVGELADAEPLLALPALAYPAQASAERTVTAQALVPFRGNFYSVPPGLSGAVVSVRWRLDEPFISIATVGGAVIARHELAPRGTGQTVRDHGHVVALERAVLRAFTDAPPCRSKVRKPPSEQARAEADALRGRSTSADPAARVVIDLSTYADVAARLRTAPGNDEKESKS